MAAKDGKTAFIVAALNGHEECAKLLTENGADWHAPHKPPFVLRRRKGLTAGPCACWGLCRKVEDGQGRSGLDYAEAADHKAIIALLNTGR